MIGKDVKVSDSAISPRPRELTSKKMSQRGIPNARGALRKDRNPLLWATLAVTDAIPVQSSLQPSAHLSVSARQSTDT